MRRLTVLTCVVIAVLVLLPSTFAAERVRTVPMRAREFRFTPASISLKVGERVAVRITNRGTVDHEFLSTILKAAEDVEVKVGGVRIEAEGLEEAEFEPGETVTIEFTPTKAGRYAFWCAERFKGKLHRDLGMRGTFTVTP